MSDLSAHVAWCRSMFDALAEGGVWGVPRSGVVFQKQGEELVMISAMPWSAELPITHEQLSEQQADEFETVQRHFGAAGITVRRLEPGQLREGWNRVQTSVHTDKP